jgi:hypothetical protein
MKTLIIVTLMVGVVSQVINEPKCAYHPYNKSQIRSGHHLVGGLVNDGTNVALLFSRRLSSEILH